MFSKLTGRVKGLRLACPGLIKEAILFNEPEPERAATKLKFLNEMCSDWGQTGLISVLSDLEHWNKKTKRVGVIQ